MRILRTMSNTNGSNMNNEFDDCLAYLPDPADHAKEVFEWLTYMIDDLDWQATSGGEKSST